jgi:transcriptional regulator with XRE-family HTH domain
MELIDRINQIEEWRAKADMSYRELARLSTVDVGTVWKILNHKAKNPSYDSLEALVAVFNSQSDAEPDR